LYMPRRTFPRTCPGNRFVWLRKVALEKKGETVQRFELLSVNLFEKRRNGETAVAGERGNPLGQHGNCRVIRHK